MMKPIIVLAFAALLLFGCVSGQVDKKTELEKELNESVKTKVPENGLISVSGDDKISVVTIKAVNTSGKWQFPLSAYEDEFAGAGLYSDSFIMLNSSHVKWMDSGEALWLTPMLRNGKGVLFNAIYSNEAANCSSGRVRILGKEYALSEMKNGSSFLFDDKWKVAIEGGTACPGRVAIYLNGYFDDLEEGDQISLFRNDNTVLLEFVDMDSEPKVKVVVAKPAQG